MEEFTQKWAIIAPLEDVSDGSEFYYTDIPLHLTLAGIFSTYHDGSWLKNELTKILFGQSSISITANKKAMFGPNKDVAVMRIMKEPELTDLYQKIHSWLVESGAVYDWPEYEGAGYLPHSTFQKSGSLKEGEIRQIKSVSIIDLFPNGNGYYRKVLKTIELE